MKHILKTTVIGGMGMLCCFALEAMDIDSHDSENISTSGERNLFNHRGRQVSKLDLFDQNIRSIDELNERLVGIDLNSVQTLILSKNPLTTLEGFPNFPNLQRLYMVGCQLKSLEGCPNLPALRVLSLENNQISDLSGLQNISSDLEQLYLNNNQIDSMSELLDSIEPRFRHLKKLNLSHNRLKNIHNENGYFLDYFTELEDLDFSNNQLKTLCIGLGSAEMVDLKRLDVSNNQLPSILLYLQARAKDLPPSLESLNLFGNRISEEEIIRISRAIPNCNVSFQDNEGRLKAAFGGNVHDIP